MSNECLGFDQDELEMIQCIRNINQDQSIDPYEALQAYIEVIGK